MEDKSYLPEYREDDLPSRGIQYPKGVRVYYRPYSLGELLKINQYNFDETELYQFIMEGIKVVGMEKEDLTYYDVSYLGWRRKAVSMEASIVDTYSFCPNCDTKNSKSISLNDLDFVDTDVKAMPIKTKINGKDLKFRYITIRDYMELIKEDKHLDAISIYAKSVVDVPFEEAYDIIYNATGNDLEKLSLIDIMLYHGLQRLKFTCQNKECNQEYDVEITNSQEVEILKPFRSKEDIISDEISFGE